MRGGRHTIASVSLLSLVLGYGVLLFFEADEDSRTGARQLSSSASRALLAAPHRPHARALAHDAGPPAADEVPGEYIVKPWVGYAQSVTYSYENTEVTLLSAQASTNEGAAHLPRYIIEPQHLKWSSAISSTGEEWVQIDMGVVQDSVSQIKIAWDDQAYAVDYTVQVGPERVDCRSGGGSCADYWIDAATVTGKSDGSVTTDDISNYEEERGIRFVRILMNKRAPGQDAFAIYRIKLFTKAEVVGETPSTTYCGATTAGVAGSLLATHGGSLLATFDASEFFHATLTAAQRDAIDADPCTYTVEHNYIVRARGTDAAPRRRRLAIPEFNMRDDNPPNWGLERISSHGRLNGKYTWFHEGEQSHIYFLDVGVYPDHSEWELPRDGTSRFVPAPKICAGTATDYESNVHGTHVASIAAGWTFGTAKSGMIHPIQVLDANGEGTTASVLCGLEMVIQDIKNFVPENTGDKYAAVVNLSLGVDGRSDVLDKVVQEMTELGAVVVIAAGDNNANACFYSPIHSSAVVVGSLRSHPEGYNDKTATSNFGQCIDIWAPGEDIVGASSSGEYDSISRSGTSVAAAFASGAATLFFEATNLDLVETYDVTAFVKEKILAKSEKFILGDIGHGSPSQMLQTTVSKCTLNSHCETGLTCIFDGTCRDLTKPLKQDQPSYELSTQTGGL